MFPIGILKTRIIDSIISGLSTGILRISLVELHL